MYMVDECMYIVKCLCVSMWRIRLLLIVLIYLRHISSMQYLSSMQLECIDVCLLHYPPTLGLKICSVMPSFYVVPGIWNYFLIFEWKVLAAKHSTPPIYWFFSSVRQILIWDVFSFAQTYLNFLRILYLCSVTGFTCFYVITI